MVASSVLLAALESLLLLVAALLLSLLVSSSRLLVLASLSFVDELLLAFSALELLALVVSRLLDVAFVLSLDALLDSLLLDDELSSVGGFGLLLVLERLSLAFCREIDKLCDSADLG